MRRLVVALTATALAAAVGAPAATARAGAPAAATRSAPTAHSAGAPARWVMGYYPMYLRHLMPPSQITWSAMTHLVVGAVLPKADGSLDTSFYGVGHGARTARQLAAAANGHGVVPLLMVGGAGARDGFAAAAANHPQALAANLLRLMRADGFKGLDLDWEPVDSGDAPAIKTLVKRLRTKAPHTVLTMPVAWVNANSPDVPSLYGWLASRLDRIDIMTYGMAGAYDGWKTWHSSALTGAGSATPSDVASNVRAYEAAGVPAKRLGIGIGFYGMCWDGGVTGPRQPIGSSSVVADDNVMTYTRIQRLYYSSAAYHFDSAAHAPYLGFAQPTGPQGCTYVSYEDRRSVTAKGQWAENHGLGAEIVWAINEGHDRSAKPAQRDALLRAVSKAFH
jgi:chitinase